MTESNNDRSTSSHSKKKVDPYIGRLLGDTYQIVSLLGQGATTSVYKAQDTKHDRFVAVKILHFQFGSNEGTVKRFQQETKTISRLNHVNIAAYYDNGVTDNDEHYLVLEFADGKNLKQLIQETGAIEWKRAIRLFLQICAALGAAHQNGVVHRDLKPANIIVTKDSQGNELVKLLDFGVAKLLIQGETFQTKTQTGEMLGTLLYMSPEQCLDQDLDGRSDIYSLGCVLFEALTALPPFTARTAFETMNLHLTGVPEKLAKVRPELSFPKHMDSCIQKALAKDPKRRYQTVSALAEDLHKLEKDLPIVLEKKSNTTAAVASTPVSFAAVASASAEKPKSKIKLLIKILCVVFVLGFPGLLFVPIATRLAVITIAFIIIASLIVLYELTEYITAYAANDPGPAKKLLTQQSAGERDRFDIEHFAQSVFDRLDQNKDGFITEAEMKDTLKSERSSLSLHDKTFIQFVLDHYDDFKEIFDDQGERIGISRTEILEFARSIPEATTAASVPGSTRYF